MSRNKYPLTKMCAECSGPFTVRNGAEFRNVTCSKPCGDKRAARARSGENHWNFGNPRDIKPFKGKHHTAEAKESNRQKHKGRPTWNKGLTGVYSAETIEQMRAHKRGRRASPQTEFQKGLVPWNKGAKFPERSGPHSPSWKGGRTPELKKLRNGREFAEWRQQVFIRDDWTCQKCFKRGVPLHPHHVLNFSEHAELRFAVDNGVTLCTECHKEFHRLYKRRHNTREQLAEYLSVRKAA